MTLQEMVAALEDMLGISQAEIGRRVGLTQQTINRAANGCQLSYQSGKLIEGFYKREFRKKKRKAKG